TGLQTRPRCGRVWRPVLRNKDGSARHMHRGHGTAGLRVVMFSNLYPPVVSGSATQSSSLARELAKRGCEVAVITARVAGGSPEYERVDGVHVHRLPALRLPKAAIALNFPWLSYTFTPANLRRIAAILDRHSPDVLHL